MNKFSESMNVVSE